MDGACTGTTQAGARCKNRVRHGERCAIHARGDAQCSVCFQGLCRNTRKLPCGHEFHTKCIDRWKRSCRSDPTGPMCRTPFDLPMYRIRLTIQRVREGTTESQVYTTSNIHGIQSEFGLDMRLIDTQADATLNILFDLEEHENLAQVLESLGIPGVY